MNISPLQIFTFAIITVSQIFANEPVDKGSQSSKIELEKKDPIEMVRLYTDALSAIKIEDWNTASNNLKTVFSTFPNHPLPYLGFGKFHFAREEYASGENALVKGLEIAPLHTELLYEHSKLLEMKGDLPFAINQAYKATENFNSKWKHHYWLHHLLKNNNELTIAKINLEIAIEKLDLEIRKWKTKITNDQQQEKNGNHSADGAQKLTESMENPDEWQEILEKLQSKKDVLKEELLYTE